MTQTTDVLEYLNTHGSITPLEALRELGIMRLAARVNDLENRGYVIPRKLVTVKARNGRKCRVTEYRRPK